MSQATALSQVSRQLAAAVGTAVLAAVLAILRPVGNLRAPGTVAAAVDAYDTMFLIVFVMLVIADGPRLASAGQEGRARAAGGAQARARVPPRSSASSTSRPRAGSRPRCSEASSLATGAVARNVWPRWPTTMMAQRPPLDRVVRWIAAGRRGALFGMFLVWFVALDGVVYLVLDAIVADQHQQGLAQIATPLMTAFGALFAFLTAFVITIEWNQHRDVEQTIGLEADACVRLIWASGRPAATAPGPEPRLLAVPPVGAHEEWPTLAHGWPTVAIATHALMIELQQHVRTHGRQPGRAFVRRQRAHQGRRRDGGDARRPTQRRRPRPADAALPAGVDRPASCSR